MGKHNLADEVANSSMRAGISKKYPLYYLSKIIISNKKPIINYV
jgi:hypothetical protein